jgi:hypothetical protein
MQGQTRIKFFTEQQRQAFRCFIISIVFTTLAIGSSSLAEPANFGIRFDNGLCLQDMRRWKKAKGWKAIAITRTVGIAQGCGTVWKFESRAEAKKQALKACNANIKYPVFQGRTACRIVALEK